MLKAKLYSFNWPESHNLIPCTDYPQGCHLEIYDRETPGFLSHLPAPPGIWLFKYFSKHLRLTLSLRNKNMFFEKVGVQCIGLVIPPRLPLNKVGCPDYPVYNPNRLSALSIMKDPVSIIIILKPNQKPIEQRQLMLILWAHTSTHYQYTRLKWPSGTPSSASLQIASGNRFVVIPRSDAMPPNLRQWLLLLTNLKNTHSPFQSQFPGNSDSQHSSELKSTK